MPRLGCSAPASQGAAASLQGAVVDDTSVFWTDAGAAAGTGVVRRCSLDGACCTTIGSSLHDPEGLATDGVSVHLTNGQSTARCSDGAGA